MEDNVKALALHVIHQANLGHPTLPLVESFLRDAKDGDQAAKYLLKVYEDDKAGVKFSEFVEDWISLVKLFYVENPRSGSLHHTTKKRITQRDDYRCCVTGIRGRLWNTNRVFPIIPLVTLCLREHREKRFHDLLGAFITPAQRDLLLSEEGIAKNLFRNHWTLSKDAAVSFSRGELRLQNLNANEYEIRYNDIGSSRPAFYTLARLFQWQCNLADHSNSGIESPDQLFLEIHSRFSRALKWTHISGNMPPRSHSRRVQSTIENAATRPIFTSLLTAWLKFPTMIRLQTYKVLRAAGKCFYGANAIADGIQRLPFGMYLKYGPICHSDRHTREFDALKLVYGCTSIPVPCPIDLISSPTESLLVTSRMAGDPAGIAIDTYSDEEMELMAEDLRTWVAELHSIKMTSESTCAITSASGGPILDYRIDSAPVGPFRDEKAFSESLRLGILPSLVHSDDHQILFCHGDLNMRNILTKDGRITGIVDWENAGWYPEYWEYTKCHFSVSLCQRWLRMVDTVFENKYRDELEIERQYWQYHSAW